MHTIERNDKSKLEQKLLTPASQNNGIKVDIACCCYSSKIRCVCGSRLPPSSSTVDMLQLKYKLFQHKEKELKE